LVTFLSPEITTSFNLYVILFMITDYDIWQFIIIIIIIIIIAVIFVIIPEPWASHRRLTVYIFAYVRNTNANTNKLSLICSCWHLCYFFPHELL
jgi:hypothetical protein